MREDEREEKREVNPAMRRDPPRTPAPPGEPRPAPGARPPKATQGAELDPRDEGGIAE